MFKASLKYIHLKKGLVLLALTCCSFSSFAQDDLMKMLDEEEKKEKKKDIKDDMKESSKEMEKKESDSKKAAK